MLRKEAKRFFSVLMTMLMILSVFSGSIATLYSVDAYSAPYTYWFEEGNGGATDQKVIKMKFPGKTVSGVVKDKIDVNDAYAKANANYAASGDTITISFAELGYKDGGYELTFNPGSITFGNFIQPVAYTVKFFARDINPGAQTLFVDSGNTGHTNDEILSRNTFDDITLTYEGETITEVYVAHEQLEASTDANYLTNITVKTVPEVQKLKIKFVGTTVSKDEEMMLYSTEGGNNVNDGAVTANVFKTSIVGIKDSDIDMTLRSYDGNGKFINEKTIMMISNGNGQKDPDNEVLSKSENSVADIMNGNVDDFEEMLNNLTSLDELKVSYKNSEGVRYVSNIHELAETFVDPNVHHVMLTSSMTSNAELTFDNDTMYIDGQNNTYKGDIKLLNTGAAVARMCDIEVDGKITVDISSQGKAYFENVTADEIKIVSSDDQNCVHISNSDIEKVTVANNTNVKVVIEGTTQIDQMDIMPKAVANKVEIANASKVGKSAVAFINVKNVDTDSPVIKLSGDLVDPNVPSDIKTKVEQDTSAVDDGSKSKLEIMKISNCTGKEIEGAGGFRIVLSLDGESKFDKNKSAELKNAVQDALSATGFDVTGLLNGATVDFISNDKMAVIVIPAIEFKYSEFTADKATFEIENTTENVKLVDRIDEIVSGRVEAGSSLEDDITFDVERSIDLKNISIVKSVETADKAKIDVTLAGALAYTGELQYAVAANKNSIDGWFDFTNDAIPGLVKADSEGKYLYIMQKGQTNNMRQIGRINGLDQTAPTNQDTVFAADVTVKGGATVTIVSSGDAANEVWFAPVGTTIFVPGNTMTKAASGTSTSIAAPATARSYKLFVIDAAGNVSSASTKTLTVDNTAPTLTKAAYLDSDNNAEIDKIELTFSEDILASSVALADFTFGATDALTSANIDADDVSVSGNKITITIDADVAADNKTVATDTLAWSADAFTNLAGLGIAARAAATMTDEAAPVLININSAGVNGAITMTFSENVTSSALVLADFAGTTVNNVQDAVTAVTANADATADTTIVTNANVAPAMTDGEALTVTIAASGQAKITDAAGNALNASGNTVTVADAIQ